MTTIHGEVQVQEGRPETPRESAQRRLRSLKTGVVAASVASLVGFMGVAVAQGGGDGGTASPGARADSPQVPADGSWRADDTHTPTGGYVPGESWDADDAAPDWRGAPSDGGGTVQPDGGFFGGGGAPGPVDGSGAS